MRRFELSEGSSNKFWEIDLEGTGFTVRWGRLGTDGQTQQKSFPTAAKAQSEHDKLVAEKVKKGYTETGGAASAVTPPRAPSGGDPPEAPPERLPPVLASPPWRARHKPPGLPVLDGVTPPPLDETLADSSLQQWNLGEQLSYDAARLSLDTLAALLDFQHRKAVEDSDLLRAPFTSTRSNVEPLLVTSSTVVTKW